MSPDAAMVEDPWVSVALPQSFLYAALATIVLTAVHDVVSVCGLPSLVARPIRLFCAPFRNFLYLEDLEEAATSKPRISPPRWKLRSLAILSLLQIFGYVGLVSCNIVTSRHAESLISAAMLISWAYATTRICLKPPSTPPYLLMLFYLCALSASAIAVLLSALQRPPDIARLVVNIVTSVTSAALLYIVGTLPIKDVLPGPSVATGKRPPSSSTTMPEDAVTLWEWCTFSFIEPIFDVATTRRLEYADVWTLSPFFKHKNLFRKYLEYRELHPSHSLIWFLIASNSLDLILDIVLELWSAVVGFLCIYALQRILMSLADPSPKARADAYFYAFVTFLAHLSFAQVDLFQMWHSRRSYERTRGQLFCALHYKALRRRDLNGKSGRSLGLDDSEPENADLGKIVNLMQGDAYTVSYRFWQASAVFAATVRLIIALIFLHRVLGPSAYAGVVVVLVAYILNYPLGKYNVFITRGSRKATDARMTGVNELFQNIRFLKFYGWENHWADGVLGRRDKELKWRIKENVISALISFIWIWVPSAMALSSFLCYTTIAGGRLSVSKTFTSLALFSMLQGPMMELPEIVFSFLHAYVSYQRITTFFQEEEVPQWACSLMNSASPGVKLEEIGFSDAVFEWNRPPNDSTEFPGAFRLGPLDFCFPLGRMSLITGATGSGKSAMLASLLGEIHCVSGEVLISKSNQQIGYCAQSPWLEHATIRDNIIFGSKRGFDEVRYETVIEACALNRDLDMFDARDLTEIGEKGVTLSGGQRARVALARAFYSDATCLLLDDPLAAVDMHTAQHIVEHCFRSKLSNNRTLILVTHHISLCLPSAEYIVEVSNGEVIRKGTVKDLQASGQLKTVIDVEDDRAPPSSGFSEASVGAVVPVNEADVVEVPASRGRKNSGIAGKLIDAEARAEGRVSIRTYLTYVKAAGWLSWILTLALMLLIRLINIANDLFLAKWSEAYEQGDSRKVEAFILLVQTSPVWRSRVSPLSQLPSPDVNTKPWLLIYLWISVAGGFATLAYISLGYYASLQASRKLFRQMLLRLIRAPSRFFDVTPMGRILNRFTSDMSTVDFALQQSARAALTGGLMFLASFLFIVVVIPQFTPVAIFIGWLYVRIAPPYIQAARDLRRLESVSLSPAFAGFDELLRGLSHIRAFGMERRYQDSFYKKVDTFQAFDHVYWLVAGWLRWRYDCLGSVVVFVTTLFALWSGVSDGFAAIVIVQAGVFAEASRQLVKVAAQLELDFNSVERIGEYLAVPQEGPPIINEKRPPAYWPSNRGSLVVEDLVVKYAPDLPPVIQGISFTVNAGEKIGIVGRTGSGKSTLALSLLRIIEPSGGKIILDGIDITSIGLEDLRTRITIVSQDVSLFSGTIRSNLDPFGEHSDHECLDVLARCRLTGRDHGSPTRPRNAFDLDTSVSPTGSLSAGERQLVALARAILRRSQVIILDEATSQIDTFLDDQIQRTIREELSGALVISIAHRLKTIVDYDRILVLGDGGKVAEFDTPRRLFTSEGGMFREMCRRSADWEELRGVIEQ